MAKAGFCAECNAPVWVCEDGTCQNGHAASSVSGVYETGAPPPAAPGEPSKNKWGGAVVAVVIIAVVLGVCLVAGILVAIAIPVFNAASDSARERACFSNQRVVEGAAQQWLANNPDATAADIAGPVESGGPLVPAFIREVPRCQASPSSAYVLDDKGRTTCPAGDPPDGHGHYSD